MLCIVSLCLGFEYRTDERATSSYSWIYAWRRPSSRKHLLHEFDHRSVTRRYKIFRSVCKKLSTIMQRRVGLKEGILRPWTSHRSKISEYPGIFTVQFGFSASMTPEKSIRSCQIVSHLLPKYCKTFDLALYFDEDWQKISSRLFKHSTPPGACFWIIQSRQNLLNCCSWGNFPLPQ